MDNVLTRAGYPDTGEETATTSSIVLFHPVTTLHASAFDLKKGCMTPDRMPLPLCGAFQVLVVVTASWDVMCFDHNLRLQWTHRVKVHTEPAVTCYLAGLITHEIPWQGMHKRFMSSMAALLQDLQLHIVRSNKCSVFCMQEDVSHGAHMTVKEVAIHISNHTTRVGDRGVVVVGGSVDLGDLAHHGDAGESVWMSLGSACAPERMLSCGCNVMQMPMSWSMPLHLDEQHFQKKRDVSIGNIHSLGCALFSRLVHQKRYCFSQGLYNILI